jgi:Tol biopolymer transport system component
MLGWKRRLAAVLVATALTLPAVAHAQYFGQNKIQYQKREWKSITSDHFEVYFYAGLDSLAMRVLDLAEKTDIVLSQRMGHSLGRRVPIIIYGSHNDFAQTNVTPELIDGGTGGFTEVLRNRVVLPFPGSYEDLRHVVVHELTHAFMFDELYQGSASSMIARQSFFSAPLWFAEGMAEYFSLGMESNAEVFLRDGTVEGYLPPLQYSGGYIVYKQGQSAISYLCARYGEERLRELLRRIRQMRNFDRAFEKTMGMPVAKFDERWQAWLKKQYWPTVARKDAPEEFARRLTDHRRDPSHFNTSPTVSPQGDRIAFFSDRRQYTDVFLMSALDGKIERRVIRGERSVKFESIPSFRSSLSWSPDGRTLALTAKSGGRDVLYLIDADTGKMLREIHVDCDALSYPTWSPVSDSLVVVGLRDARSDLYMVNLKTGRVTQLTNDTWDEKDPTWSPDGREITFSSDRLAPVVLHPVRTEKGFGAYAIYSLELETGAVNLVCDTAGDDRCPAWAPDGRRLAFITDYSGTPNIYLYDPADSNFTQLTDVLGGVQNVSWSRQNDRLVFSAYNRGGIDVFAVREPLSVDGVLARLRRQSPQAVVTFAQAQRRMVDSVKDERPLGALANVWPDSTGAPNAGGDTTRTTGSTAADPRTETTAHADTLRLSPDDADMGASPWARGEPMPFPAYRDSVPVLQSHFDLVERGGPFEVPDSVLSQKATPYKPRLAPDYGGAGFFAASGYGVVGSTQFVFSDFLGDHSLYLATDVLSQSLSETNAIAVYNYLPRRWDYGFGVFHFKDYLNSNVTGLGEALGSSRLFSERRFGGILSTAYPFDQFKRVEFTFTQMFLERQFFEEDLFGNLFKANTEYRSVTSPAVSLIGDNTLFGYYGPVNGVRYNLTYSPSFAVADHGLSYQTVTLDMRRYWDLTSGYTFFGRVLAGASGGTNPQTFRVGGWNTLRGYEDFSLYGSRIAITNIELRFPFIQQMGLVGPVPIGLFNLRGVLFADLGAVWYDDQRLRLTHVVDGHRRTPNPVLGDGIGAGFGTGIRTSFAFMILKLDVGWPTDFYNVSRPQWYFSIGPEF